MPKDALGLTGAARAWHLVGMRDRFSAILAIAASDEVEDIAEAARAFAREGKPEMDVIGFEFSDDFARLAALSRLSRSFCGIVVTTPAALTALVSAPDHIARQRMVLASGKHLPFDDLVHGLTASGYRRVDFVEDRAQFSRRGEILDIWPLDREQPARAVFDGDMVETVRAFDPATQRSLSFLESVAVCAAQDHPEAPLAAHLPEGFLLYLDRPAPDPLPDAFAACPRLINDPLGAGAGRDHGLHSLPPMGGIGDLFTRELSRTRAAGCRAVIYCANEGERERVEDLLGAARWDGPDPEIRSGMVRGGFWSAAQKIAVFSAQDILYTRRQVRFPVMRGGRRLEGLWEISSGDHVVHERYGIGRYRGLKRLARGGQEQEYLTLEYKGGDRLYVPVDDFRVVQKYVGIEGCRPRLFSMDTAAWEHIKARASENAREYAEKLLALYAQRRKTPGHAFPAETAWDRELADLFAYEETPDQRRAIEEVRQDLSKPWPMDRIICGDVGFGKTEVAVRAAFAVVQDSRQAAVLVPTTVLAEQHYETFSNRLSPFATRVAMLSRFQTKAEQARVVQGLAAGSVDIVIGTHRLLQKDIAFHDLGLLIIDEEHRFGVTQKEKITALRAGVDVLLMSATPIPRTISMALSKMRDLSVIETPPVGRQPIETHVAPHDDELTRRVIAAELGRGGQVYYVYNRVETIQSRAARLAELAPGARVGVVHGQMRGGDIEKAMWRFTHRELDILVATTIIESGLDIPTVNTMVVEEAEDLGLAQLYQLRGRIGRDRQKAYCYLLYTPDNMTDESRRRLESLSEFSELGSGFRLALRDLEIRGAGALLSPKQHGFVRDVGIELYGRLIEEAMGERPATPAAKAAPPAVVTIDLRINAHLPGEYIEAEDVRIGYYRRLADVTRSDQADAIAEELRDRFGKPPAPVDALLNVARLRAHARAAGLAGIVQDDEGLTFSFDPARVPGPGSVLALGEAYGERITFARGGQPVIHLRTDGPGEDALTSARGFCDRLSRMMGS